MSSKIARNLSKNFYIKVVFVLGMILLGTICGSLLNGSYGTKNTEKTEMNIIERTKDTTVTDFLKHSLLELYTVDRPLLKAVGLSDKSCDILLPKLIYRPIDIEKLGLSQQQIGIIYRNFWW